MSEIVVGAGALQPDDVVAVVRRNARVVLAPAAEAEIERSRKAIEALAADAEPHYGVSTGFGARWPPGTYRWTAARPAGSAA